MLQLQITLRAAAQIEKANRWWLENRLAAPEAFIDDLQAAFHLLARQPGIGSKVVNARAAGVRRLHLGRVHYFVLYRVKGEELVVLAVWHSSRAGKPAV